MNQSDTERIQLGADAGSPRGGERWRETARHLSLTAPAFLLITLFFAFPIIVVIVVSVTDPVPGLQNYAWVFTSPLALRSALTTVVISLSVTLICLLLAYPYAHLMTIVSERTRAVMTLLVMVPLWTSILVRTLAWVVLLQDTGPVNAFFETVGIGHVQLIRTPLGVAIGMAQVLLPFMVMPLYSSISRIEPRLVPAAQSLGARPVVAFFKVFLPLSKPGIFSGSITVFILALGFYIIPSLLGSPQDPMFPSLIQLQVSGFLEWGRGTALGVCLLAAALLALFLVTKLTKSGFTVPGAQNR
ncbi:MULTISPECIES: ABC transporter permease [unclassified Microbacterium]|uniref:ABC transporter permease n=1 Tax=unclassified Microbacterium TaxID=2609290 RepID=UPI00301B4943